MKKRKGFVSNSSSASYIVEIRDIKEDDFAGLLGCEYSWDGFNLDSVRNRIAKRVEELEELQKTENNTKTHDKYLGFFYREQLEDYKKLKEISLQVNDDDSLEVIKFILEYNDIKYKAVDGDIELDYFTSMHNDYVDGMSDLLKEIVLFFMFETDYKIKCKVDKD